MLANYLKIILRQCWRSKGFSFLNLFGLAVGFGVCLLILLFVQHERQYDCMYKPHLYRLGTQLQKNEKTAPEKTATSLFPLASLLAMELPGIKSFTRVMYWGKVPLQAGRQTVVPGTLLGADSSFLHLLGLPLLQGNTTTALQRPNSIVLTQSMASRLFGRQDAIGQVLRHEGRDTMIFTVTGILAGLPAQSHIQFDALYSMSTVERPDWSRNWATEWIITYLELGEKTDPKTVEAAFPAILRKHLPADKQPGYQLFLQPVQDIHLYSEGITRDLLNHQPFNGQYIPLLMAVAFFVLLLGVINYINLHTARLLTRTKEVGIRKTSGAGYRAIVWRFLCETGLYMFLSFLGALLFLCLAIPWLARFTQKDLHLRDLVTTGWIGYTAGLLVIACLLGGLLPAFTMARINPVTALKGRWWTGYRSPLRSLLVVVQFTIAIGLSLAAIMAFRQFRFIQQYDLGFNRTGVLVIPVSDTDRPTEERLMQALRHLPGVKDVTGALRRLGNPLESNEVIFEGSEGRRRFRCANMFVDLNYTFFYDIPLLAGRGLSATFAGDRNGQSYVINETMARMLRPYSNASDTSLATLIGQRFGYGFSDSLGTIVGITRDFHVSSLYRPMEPVCLSYLYEYYFTDLSLKLDGRHTAAVLSQVERVWKTHLPMQPFSWHFLDDHLQQLYRSDRQAGALMLLFAVIALVISCLGLIGVATFVMERRAKEVSIRKAMGATVERIIYLLSKDFLLLVLISIGMAVPLSWWAIQGWMQDFAYHTETSWLVFAVTSLLALLLAALTIGIQVARAARANPVKHLNEQ